MKNKRLMHDERHNYLDIRTKYLSIVATVLSIGVGLFVVFSQQSKSTKQEFIHNSLEKQTEVYAEVCKSAGSLTVNTDNIKLFEIAKKNYLELYYGDRVFIKDSSVELAMKELKDYLDVIDFFSAEEFKDEGIVNGLKLRVLDLSEVCKTSSLTYEKEMEKK